MKKFLVLISLLFVHTVFAETYKCNVLQNDSNWDFPADELVIEVDYQNDLTNVLLFSDNKLLSRYNECGIKRIEFMGYYEAAFCNQPDGEWAYFYMGPILWVMKGDFGPVAEIECQLN